MQKLEPRQLWLLLEVMLILVYFWSCMIPCPLIHIWRGFLAPQVGAGQSWTAHSVGHWQLGVNVPDSVGDCYSAAIRAHRRERRLESACDINRAPMNNMR